MYILGRAYTRNCTIHVNHKGTFLLGGQTGTTRLVDIITQFRSLLICHSGGVHDFSTNADRIIELRNHKSVSVAENKVPLFATRICNGLIQIDTYISRIT